MTLSSLNSHFMVILVFILSKFEEITAIAIVSPSSIENVCPGEKISLVCLINGESLKWLVPDPIGVRVNLDRAFIRLLSENTVGERLPIDGDTLGAYAVTLNSVTPNLSSTLEVTLYRSMDGQNIVCSGQSIVMVPIDLYDPPAPASNIHITSTLNNTEESIVSFEWDYFSDGAPVNYSVTVIWGLENDTVSAVTVEMGIELTLRYNTEHAVTVEVISCAESSFSSIFTFKLIRCDAPSSNSAINGMFQITSHAEGGTLTLTCNEGFRSTGPNFATCMQHSLWQPNLQLLQCVSNSTALQCPPLEEPPNGRFIDYEYTNRTSLTGTVVTYHCDSGLFPNDIKSTTCREDGTWSNIPFELICRKESDIDSEEVSLTINEVAVICTIVTFFVAMVSGCVCGALLTYWIIRKKAVYSPAAEGQANVGPTASAGPVYEEASPKEEIKLNINQAYGPVGPP